MNRNGFLATLIASAAAIGGVFGQRPPADQGDTVLVEVGPGKDLKVTVPHIAKDSVASVISSFFARDQKASEDRFRKLLADSGELTLVITTKTNGSK